MNSLPETVSPAMAASNLLLQACEAETRHDYDMTYAHGLEAQGLSATWRAEGNVALCIDHLGNVPHVVVLYRRDEGFTYLLAPFRDSCIATPLTGRLSALALVHQAVSAPMEVAS